MASGLLVHKVRQAGAERVQEAFTRFMTIPALVLFGTVLPWQRWFTMGWPLFLLAVVILLLRRIPMVVALKAGLKPLKTDADVLFAGWFGPIGVAALFYAMLALRRIDNGQVWVIASPSSLLPFWPMASPPHRSPTTMAAERAIQSERGSRMRMQFNSSIQTIRMMKTVLFCSE